MTGRTPLKMNLIAVIPKAIVLRSLLLLQTKEKKTVLITFPKANLTLLTLKNQMTPYLLELNQHPNPMT